MNEIKPFQAAFHWNSVALGSQWYAQLLVIVTYLI